MRRKLLSISAVLSLLLLVATTALWVRSYWTFDDFGRRSTSLTSSAYTQHLIRLGSNDGRFLFTWRDIIWLSSNPSFDRVSSTWDRSNGTYFTHEKTFDAERKFMKQPNDRSWEVRWAGFRYERLIHDTTAPQPVMPRRRVGPPPGPGMAGFVVFVPHAYVCTAFAILTCLFTSRWRRLRRTGREGLCPTCCYNLTANISGVCPECGTTVPGKARTV